MAVAFVVRDGVCRLEEVGDERLSEGDVAEELCRLRTSAQLPLFHVSRVAGLSIGELAAIERGESPVSRELAIRLKGLYLTGKVW